MECAVYNVADYRFSEESNYINCLHVLEDMAKAGADPDIYGTWEEVNGLKYLFRSTQAWTVNDMVRLVDGAANYLRNG
jgi:hypothetical protein